MSGQIGEKLPDLDQGDSIAVVVNGIRYEGRVADTERWKCELNRGFMEDGAMHVYVELNAETVDKHNLSSGYLLISATENVPHDWDVPRASIYNIDEDELITSLGDVADLESPNGSVN